MHYTFSKKAQAIHRQLSRSDSETSRPVARTATSGFLPLVQAKLHIAAPNDKYEQEADRVADQVMRMAEPETMMIDSLHARSVQRQCAGCGGGQELCLECEEELQCEPKESVEKLQAEAAPRHAASVAPPLEAKIRSEYAEGEPLTALLRAFFEPRFGVNFSGVRIHAGPNANAIAQSLTARAFTIGSKVMFGPAEYNPRSSAGLNLLAHELTHVVQQGGATPSSTGADPLRKTKPGVIQRKDGGERESFEVKGSTPAPSFRSSKTMIEDAPALPSELRGKPKAYFLITYEPAEFYMFTETAPGAEQSEKESIEDEMEYLKDAGYVVVYIERATENDVISAFADPQAFLIFTCGHGQPPGVIRTTNLDVVEPSEIVIPPGSELSQVILENCNIGDQYEKWKAVLPRFAGLTAWTGKTTTTESVRFNSGGGFAARQWGSLMSQVKGLPILENQSEGIIYRVTEKGEFTKTLETGEVSSELPFVYDELATSFLP
jgi:Domain of unknown function (DUF4157)